MRLISLLAAHFSAMAGAGALRASVRVAVLGQWLLDGAGKPG
jgi:hypothetical protein